MTRTDAQYEASLRGQRIATEAKRRKCEQENYALLANLEWMLRCGEHPEVILRRIGWRSWNSLHNRLDAVQPRLRRRADRVREQLVRLRQEDADNMRNWRKVS